MNVNVVKDIENEFKGLTDTLKEAGRKRKEWRTQGYVGFCNPNVAKAYQVQYPN